MKKRSSWCSYEMRRAAVVVGFAVALIASAKPPTNDEEAAAAWMKASAVPLQGDLAPFGRMVGDARIVALGEATCGTREFFLQKRRLIEYLVANKGFTVLAMAASFPDAVAVNEYVLNGNGDPSAALASLAFWSWNTDEVLELLLWMRAWNADSSHGRKLKFYGLDMQNTPAIVAHLRRVLGGDASVALDVLAPLAKRYGYAGLPNEEKARVVGAIDVLQKLAADDHSARGDLTRQEVTLLRQAEEVFREPLGKGDRREPRMAANLKWILDHEPAGTRAVLWAFNGQAGVHAPTVPPSLGSTLRKTYGRALVIFGFAFDHGSFHAVPERKPGGIATFVVGSARAGSLDALLAQNAPPVAVLDLRTARGGARRWLESVQTMRTIAERYDEPNPLEYYARLRPVDTFDAIVFVRETTASHLRPRKKSEE